MNLESKITSHLSSQKPNQPKYAQKAEKAARLSVTAVVTPSSSITWGWDTDKDWERLSTALPKWTFRNITLQNHGR